MMRPLTDPESWGKWGLVPRTEEEIREKVLTDPENICFSFVVMRSSISEEFKEELRVLSISNPRTGLPYLTKQNYSNLYKSMYALYQNVNYGKNYPSKKEARMLVSGVSCYGRQPACNKKDVEEFVNNGTIRPGSSFEKYLKFIFTDRLPVVTEKDEVVKMNHF